MDSRHVLLVTFPVQGHINPSLQFANKLITMGIKVTFATSVYARRRMAKSASAPSDVETTNGLTFASYSDGYDDGFKRTDDTDKYMAQIRSQGSQSLKSIILDASDRGCPVTCLVYTLLLPWASHVARELHIPSALLWIQPATVFAIYYYYFNGFADQISNPNADDIEFPGIPLTLSKRDLPSFMLPSSSDDRYSFILPCFKEQFDTLDACETKPIVLVNTFDALEVDALKIGAIAAKYELIGIGPLIPPAFLDGEDPSGNSFAGDLFRKSDDCVEWLDTKPDSSVVYVSFGSLLTHQKEQTAEIARALIDTNRPFLWVIRRDNEEDNENHGRVSRLDELEKIGKIVEWCSQLEVLKHPSLGCFITHCGWNSTLESVLCGVPVVAFPHWSDQGTNAKLIEDVVGSGVRVRGGGEDGLVESGEIRRCIEEVMDGGDKSRRVKEESKRWMSLAKQAIEDGGSSNENLSTLLKKL